MGSKSNSAQSSHAVYNTRTDNSSLQDTSGIGLANSSGNFVSIQTTDAGAIEKAFNMGGGAIDESIGLASDVAGGAFNLTRNLGADYKDTARDVLNFSKSVIAQSVEGAGAALDKSIGKVSSAFESARSDSREDVLKIGLLVTAGLIGVSMVLKK